MGTVQLEYSMRMSYHQVDAESLANRVVIKSCQLS